MNVWTLLLGISLFCICDIYLTASTNDKVPKITRIVVENWKELKFKLEHINNSDVNRIWSTWYTNSKNSGNLKNYKPCNLSKDGFWVVVHPFEKAPIDSILVIGISKTNSSNGIILTNLTSFDLRDYVKPGVVTKVKFQLLRDDKNINALYFQTPNYSQNMTFNISIRCVNGYREYFTATYKKFEPHAFTKFKNIPRFTTCNISIKGISSNFRGFWSDEVVEVIKTEMSVPTTAPALCIHGGFTLLSINATTLDVVIHFKGLTRDEARGQLQGYRAHVLSGSQMRRIEASPSGRRPQGASGHGGIGPSGIHRTDGEDFRHHDDDVDDFLYSSDHDEVKFHPVAEDYPAHGGEEEEEEDEDHHGEENLEDYVHHHHGHRRHGDVGEGEEEEERDQEGYLEIANNRDYQRYVNLLSNGNQSSDGSLLSPPRAPHSGHRETPAEIPKDRGHGSLGHRARNLLEQDRSFDVDSIFLLNGLDSSSSHRVSVDVMTKRGYNDTLELQFISLPSHEDFLALPEIYDIDVIHSNKTLFVLWKVKTADEKLEDFIYTIFFCPERFFQDNGRGCTRYIEWFQVEVASQPLVSVAKPRHHFMQEVVLPPNTGRDVQRSFVFGVSATSKAGLSRGISWRTCEYELMNDPVLPKVSTFNITSESASITIERPQCSSGSGYVFAFNVSYCVLHHNADNICSGTTFTFLLHSDATKFELRDLKESQAYLLSVNVTEVTSMPPPHLTLGRRHTMDDAHLGPARLFPLSSARSRDQIHSGSFFRPNVAHFMTASVSRPPTHVVVVHPAMMAFLAVIGIIIIALLLFGIFIFCRLYKKSVKKFKLWKTVPIRPPNQENPVSYGGDPLPVDVSILMRDNYDDVNIKVEQNILPLLGEVHSKRNPIGSDSDLIKVDNLSLLSVASDSFKSFSDGDDSRGFCNDRSRDFVSVFSPRSHSGRAERSGASADGMGGKKQSSSPSFVSLMNGKNDFLSGAGIGQGDEGQAEASNQIPLDAKISGTPGKLVKAVKPLGRPPSPKGEKESNENDRVEGVEVAKEKEGGVAYRRVLPPIVGKSSRVFPVAAVVHCFPAFERGEGLADPTVTPAKTTEEEVPLAVKELNQIASGPLSEPAVTAFVTDGDHDYDLPGLVVQPRQDECGGSSGGGTTICIPFASSSSSTSLNVMPPMICSEMPPLPSSSNPSSSSSSFSSASSTRLSETSPTFILPTVSTTSAHSLLSSSSSSLLLLSSNFPSPQRRTPPSSHEMAAEGVVGMGAPKASSPSSSSSSSSSSSGRQREAVAIDDDDYTGCREHSMLPMKVDGSIFSEPARPVVFLSGVVDECEDDFDDDDGGDVYR